MAAFIAPSLSSWQLAKTGVTPLSALPPVPSVLAASVMGDETAVTTASKTFEPIMDKYALAGFASILVLSIAAVFVWATQVVPVSRTNLAISKKSGAVKDYLDELRVVGSSDTANISIALNATDISLSPTNETIIKSSDGRDFERWLFTDWLEKPAAKASGRQKEPALPILKDAKWNSGDNPVLVASALIGVGVLTTSVLERMTSLVQ